MIRKQILRLMILVLCAMASVSLYAQDHSRNWENGNIVSVTEVHLKDGMFNAYINDLNKVWRKFMEQQKKDGNVVAYAIYSNVAAREGEPDLILTVTYPNWATFDLGADYFDSVREKVLGSAEEARTANINRGELRTIGSQYTLQQINFED